MLELPCWAACSRARACNAADRRQDPEGNIPFDVEGDCYLSNGDESVEAATDTDYLGATQHSLSSVDMFDEIRRAQASLQPLHAGDTCGSSILGIDSTAEESHQAFVHGPFHFSRNALAFIVCIAEALS
jgi:hypothetical protein